MTLKIVETTVSFLPSGVPRFKERGLPVPDNGLILIRNNVIDF